MSDKRLSEDRSEIRLVSAAQRDVWTKRADDLPPSVKRSAAMNAVRRWRARRAATPSEDT
jgi:hypothetical protein